jgi:predicted  nucleic acid-binding Zn-ribbon protein
VLYWRLDSQFKQRDYSQRRALRALDAALNEAQNRWARVQRARGSVPTNTGEFAARIAALGARIAQLQQNLSDSAQQQNLFLQHLAQDELLAQKQRLAAYEVQARFSLADIYDRASAPAPAAPATPATPGESAEPAEPVAPPDTQP